LVAVREAANLSGRDCDDIAKSLAILLVANLAARPAIDVAPRIGGAGMARRPPAHADCAVDSTLLQVGNQMHVIVQVVDAGSDVPVLTRTFTGQTQTIRHVLAAIAWTVANDLEGSLELPARVRVS
jgi:hypothetical protein